MDLPIIAALATPPGQSGLAVVRLSGSGAAALADRCFAFGPLPSASVGFEGSKVGTTKRHKRSIASMKGYRCALGYLFDPESGEIIDQCIATRFVAPYSYTGEETVEFSFHGGLALRRKVLQLLFALGAEAAPAGEFSKRAFLNGKMDLAQAEAVMDLINAEAGLSSASALQQLQGQLSQAFIAFREELFALLAELEIAVDYPEHEDFAFAEDELPQRLLRIKEALHDLLSGYKQSLSLKKGLQVVLVGAPNVGKSSLLNRLSGSERAIVTDIAGTTRDTVDSLIEIAGIPVRLIDTAGIRESSDQVEKIGVARSLKAMEEADYILWTITPETLRDADPQRVAAALREELEFIPRSQAFSLLLNKLDLPEADERFAFLVEQVLPLLADELAKHSGLQSQSGIPQLLQVSAQSGQGMDDLRQAIVQVYQNLGSGKSEALRITSERHAEIVRRAAALLDQILAERSYLPLDVLSQSLLAVGDILAEISGEQVSESLINEIFSRFCVGK